MKFLPQHVFDVSLACAKNIKKYRSFFMLFVMGPYGAVLTQGAKWIKLEDRPRFGSALHQIESDDAVMPF